MEYELTEEQIEIITSLVRLMKIFSYVVFLIGFFDILITIHRQTNVFSNLILILFLLTIGVAFYLPIGNLNKIGKKKNEETDIKDLMQAFSDLNRRWTLVTSAVLATAIITIIVSL